MSNFGKKRVAGVDYDLGHLDPFKLEVKPKGEEAPTYVVRVSFGFHCFTRAITADDSPGLYMTHGKERRCFCFDRYELSKELVGMIKYAANGRAYFGEKSNFLIVESLSQENAPYVAFFDLEKAKKSDGVDAVMFVTSAHLRPELPDRLPAVSFATLVDYRIQGKILKDLNHEGSLFRKENSPRRGYFRGQKIFPKIPLCEMPTLPLRSVEPFWGGAAVFHRHQRPSYN